MLLFRTAIPPKAGCVARVCVCAYACVCVCVPVCVRACAYIPQACAVGCRACVVLCVVVLGCVLRGLC